jgi:hypothetical protein
MGFLEPDGTGRRRRFRAFVLSSVCTRSRFVYPCFREGTAEAIEAYEAAWAFFGGIFRERIHEERMVVRNRLDIQFKRAYDSYVRSNCKGA